MNNYRVTALSVGGSRNRIFYSGQEVLSSDFPPGHAEMMVDRGYMVRLSQPEIKPTPLPLQVTTVSPHTATFSTVADMCRECYSDFTNTVIVLGINSGLSFHRFKSENPDVKIICYQLEQIYGGGSLWFNPAATDGFIVGRTRHMMEWIKGCDEIWDYDIDNVHYLRSLGFLNVKFKPMRWFSGLKRKKQSKKDIDILFFGSMNDKRKRQLARLSGMNLHILTAENSVWGDDLNDLIDRSKIVLNLHYYDSALQEQVRIFPLIGNDVCVLSERSRRNYYGDLISKFETGKIRAAVTDLLTGSKWKKVSQGISTKFKNMNYKVGVAYNSFYGLSSLEDSLASIFPIVDYVCIIHQRISFNGEPQSDKNRQIIERLEKKYDVFYYENEHFGSEGVRHKRNIGLEMCRKAGCDFFIPLDTDEFYEFEPLKNELDIMWSEGIETLYSPIRSYYYSPEYWFDDTYFVPTCYRINDRKFCRAASSVLADGDRKMEERKFAIAKEPMHHRGYMVEQYIEKTQSKMASGALSAELIEVRDHLQTWKEGETAKVFLNDLNKNGRVYLAEIMVNKIC